MTSDTLLLRQVHPTWLHADRISSQAFRPTKKDNYKLSAYDGDQISPQDAHFHYTNERQLSSCGVIAVSVQECHSLDLPIEPDPEDFLEHVLIMFDGLSNTQIESKATLLRARAVSGGWLFRAEA